MTGWTDRFELRCRNCGLLYEFTLPAHASSMDIVERAQRLHTAIDATTIVGPRCDGARLDVVILQRDIPPADPPDTTD